MNTNDSDIACYKLDVDTLRQKYVDRGLPFNKACGKAIKESNETILNWIIDGGTVLAVFGSPGSGKSTFLSRMRVESGKLMFLEISGLNVPQNAFLRRLPQVECLMLWTPLEICLKRIDSREGKRLDAETGKDSLISLANLWHATYNYDGSSNWKHALKPTRAIRWEPKE